MVAPPDPGWDRSVRRRECLATLGVGLGSLAGCLSRSERESERTTPTGQPTGTATPEPVDPLSIDGQWSMAGYDQANTGYAPEATGPTTEPSVRWSKTVEQASPFQPVVAEGVLVTGTQKPMTNENVFDNRIVGFDVDTGQQLWERKKTGRTSKVGVVGTPAIANGTVVYAGDAAIGPVRALDLQTGAEQWVYENSSARPDGPVTVADGTVYLVTDERLTAIDLQDGAERWQSSELGRVPWSNEPVAVSGRHAYVWTESGRLYSLERSTGEIDWSVQFGDGTPKTVTAGSDRLFITDSTLPDNSLVALSLDDGSEMWRFETGGGPEPCAVADGHVYVSNQSSTYALDVATGKSEWETDAWGPVSVTDTTVFVGNRPVTALDRTDGSRRWTVDVECDQRPVVVDDVIFTTPATALAAPN